MGIFDDLGISDIPVIGDVTNWVGDEFNNVSGFANNLLHGLGNAAQGLGDLLNSPIFLYAMLLLGGFIIYKTL